MARAILKTIAILTTTAVPLASPATAQGVYVSPPAMTSNAPLRGQRASIDRELPRYGYRGIDVRRLSNSQVAQIAFLIYSGKSEGDIRGQIGAILRGGYLQRGLDRVFR